MRPGSEGARESGGSSLSLFAPSARPCKSKRAMAGFTLIELVMTLSILTILTLGVIPLIKTSVKRQREQQLREALREMRDAIDEFHRDTTGMQCAGASAIVQQQPATGGQPIPQAYIDPRSRVVITDCTIFGIDNPDHYPPDLKTMVDGVSITPRAQNLPVGGVNAPAPTDNAVLATKKKVYLREIPVDPMTGERDWQLCSTYDSCERDASWGQENVFNVRSKSKQTALNGENYSDW